MTTQEVTINRVVKAIEAIAAYYTTKAVVSINDRRTLVDICDKVNFVAALNNNPHFQTIKQQHKNGVVLQIKKTDVLESALVCLSR